MRGAYAVLLLSLIGCAFADDQSFNCPCDQKAITMDNIYIVESVDQETIDWAVGDIQDELRAITLGCAYFQTRVAVIAVGAQSQLVSDWGAITDDAGINGLTLPVLASPPDWDTSDAIIEDLGSRRRPNVAYVESIYESLRNEKGERQFVRTRRPVGKKTSERRAFFTNSKHVAKDADMSDYCDFCCLCLEGDTPDYGNSELETPYGGCFMAPNGQAATQTSAKATCIASNGFLPTAHDDDKNFFLLQQFDSKTPIWLGYEKASGVWTWADNQTDSYTSWADGNPASGSCAYLQQGNGFTSSWYSDDCNSNARSFLCQRRPCSTGYNCLPPLTC